MSEKNEMQQILEIVQFMQENMVTKEEIKELATKSDLQEAESRLMEHIDGLAMRTEKFDHELVAAQAKFNRLEERIEVVELRVGIAA